MPANFGDGGARGVAGGGGARGVPANFSRVEAITKFTGQTPLRPPERLPENYWAQPLRKLLGRPPGITGHAPLWRKTTHTLDPLGAPRVCPLILW